MIHCFLCLTPQMGMGESSHKKFHKTRFVRHQERNNFEYRSKVLKMHQNFPKFDLLWTLFWTGRSNFAPIDVNWDDRFLSFLCSMRCNSNHEPVIVQKMQGNLPEARIIKNFTNWLKSTWENQKKHNVPYKFPHSC